MRSKDSDSQLRRNWGADCPVWGQTYYKWTNSSGDLCQSTVGMNSLLPLAVFPRQIYWILHMSGHLHHLQHKIWLSGSRLDAWIVDVSLSFGAGTVTEAENSGNEDLCSYVNRNNHNWCFVLSLSNSSLNTGTRCRIYRQFLQNSDHVSLGTASIGAREPATLRQETNIWNKVCAVLSHLSYWLLKWVAHLCRLLEVIYIRFYKN